MKETKIKERRMKETKKNVQSSDRKVLVARVESALVRGAEKYFQEQGFVWIPSVPHIVSITGACENVNTLYSVDYHGMQAFLTQTGQTALEEMTANIEKVSTIIHSFRKENSVDNRHLTEFPLVEFEFRYNPKKQDGFDLLLGEIENTIISMVSNVLETESVSLEKLRTDYKRLKEISKPFKKISYDEAVKTLGLKWGSDLNNKHESRLMKMHGNQPMFVTRYPADIKFFNMQINRDRPEVVNSADLLLPPGGESVGSAVREHDYETLVDRLDKSKMMKILRAQGKDIADFESYLSVIRETPVPHAGCGIGLNRVMQYVLNEKNIRKVTPYPMNKEIIY